MRPEHGVSVTCDLPADASAVRSARRFCIRTLTGSVWRGRSETVELLLGELVANAVAHASSTSTVEIVWNSHLRVSVTDDSPVMPHLEPFNSAALSGRGLQFVESLADRYGFEPTATGKTVWFELDQPSV